MSRPYLPVEVPFDFVHDLENIMEGAEHDPGCSPNACRCHIGRVAYLMTILNEKRRHWFAANPEERGR